MVEKRTHWENIYRSKSDTELSWLQDRPEASLSMLDAVGVTPRRVIDIGGGQSTFAAEALVRGAEDVVVLDIAEAAIERGKERSGAQAERVRWIVGDALDMLGLELGVFDLWHDRAVFHFLTEPSDRRRYIEAAATSVRAGGHVIIAAFAPDGPEQCSGLPVHRWGSDQLAAEFGQAFEMIRSEQESHRTPWGKPQAFTYALLKRVVAPNSRSSR